MAAWPVLWVFGIKNQFFFKSPLLVQTFCAREVNQADAVFPPRLVAIVWQPQTDLRTSGRLNL